MKRALFQNTFYGIGLILVLVSFLFYLLGLIATKEEIQEGISLIHFVLTFITWLCVLFMAIFKRNTYRFCYIFPTLVLSLISAYALNHHLNVFDASPLWLSILLVVVSAAYLSLPFFQEMPRALRFLVGVTVGIGLVVFLYLSLYLIPIYPLSVMIFWVLGISLHSFVPLLFIIFTIVWLIRLDVAGKKAFVGLAVGAGLAILFVVLFTLYWASAVNRINDTYRETFVEDEVTLPAWVRVAQRIPPNDITRKVLKVDLTYMVPELHSTRFRSFDFSSDFAETNIHDPLIVTACLLTDKPCLNREEKIKILESIYDCRHQAAERLWNDEGIITTYVNSSVLLWPQYRMAYTEQVLMLRNTKDYWRKGEAVYTFHLPEGSVVTSLSLWINGKEEKGILTTKEKADSAYRTIVGVEARDPSLVHWQEGSTVSVRVFPVTSDEERTFKIGITSPLHKRGKRLFYEPIYFEGTDFTRAKAVTQVSFMQQPRNLEYPSFFTMEGTMLGFKNQIQYDNQWSISMDDPGLSGDPFCFDNHSYTVHELHAQEIPVEIDDVYLDINHSWTKEECHAAWEITQGKKVRVYDGKRLEEVTAENKNYLFDLLQKQQFSLFPVHLIRHPEKSLLVSKSSAVSPHFSDLEGSSFYQSLKAAPRRGAVYFLCLGDELSPYLKTLREYRFLHFMRGDIHSLQTIIHRSVFVSSTPESDSSVTIHDAKLRITKEKGESSSKAPDHLMRLFAYNHILLRYAECWNRELFTFDGNHPGEDTLLLSSGERLVAEARQAYVVSPVSSLVVLESRADYERFDITDTEDSLHNASKSSNGAVPEPHEWALLAIAGAVALFLRIRHRGFIG